MKTGPIKPSYCAIMRAAIHTEFVSFLPLVVTLVGNYTR